jgi:hypothetical protein
MLLEAANIPLQAVIWFGVLGLPASAVNAVGFGLFTLLLIEGAAYWAVKLRRLSAPREPLPGRSAFAFARMANVPILAAGVLLTAWSTAADPGAATIPGLVFALFAALEHVNYFHVQLSYDTREDLRHLFARGLRRSHLSRDLALSLRISGARRPPIRCRPSGTVR